MFQNTVVSSDSERGWLGRKSPLCLVVGFAKRIPELPTLANFNSGLANTTLAVVPSNRRSRENLSSSTLPRPYDLLFSIVEIGTWGVGSAVAALRHLELILDLKHAKARGMLVLARP